MSGAPPPRRFPRLPELPVAERIKRKEHAESQFPDFPSVPIDNLDAYDNAVKELLAAAGIARLNVDVSWKDLSCRVPRRPASGPENVFSAFSALTSGFRNGWAKVTHPHAPAPGAGKETILDSVSGYLRAGETLLVLGPSGAGSSLLLNRIGHRNIGSLVDCDGHVLYNGQERLGGVVNPCHIAPMIGQLDVHAPELTVRQTLQFAANCQVPDWFPFADVLRKNTITLIARILGIERVLDTIVGSQSLRGCSGGERKRVTIAEMAMAQDAAVVLMDNWSKGLDSATTLSICRSIKQYAAMSQTVFVCAMGAPGVDAYDTFSHVCVLDSGKCLYFGPRAGAEDYFLKMGFARPPNRSVPDFCSTISDPNVNREYIPEGVQPSSLPLSAAALADRYSSSAEAAQLQAQLDEAAAHPRAAADSDDADTPEDLWKMSQRECLQSLPAQYRAVWGRQITLLGAKRQAFFQALFVNFFFGVVLGSVFWQIDADQAGAGTRGGLIFLAVLFIGLNALSTIDEKAVEKQVYTKMRAAAFFTPFPYISSLLVYDIFTQLLLTLCFAIPLWLLAGMQVGSSVQRLLYVILILNLTANICILITRVFVAVTDTGSAAHALGGVVFMILILTTGYFRSGADLPGYLVWLYWINPLHYAVEAVLINEFSDLILTCTASELQPPNTNVPDEFRVCPVSTGELYLADFLDITESERFRLWYFLVLLAYVVVFGIIASIATARSKAKGFAAQPKLQQGAGSEASDSIAISVDPEQKMANTLTFKNMKYSVDGGNKKLLQSVSGVVRPGEMVCLMGTSGAGKTTLLDVVAGRKTLKEGCKQEGEVRLNGKIVTREDLSTQAGYCEQDDIHVLQSTVREAVRFSAVLRLPASVSKEEKNRKVTKVLEQLGLLPFSDVLVKALGSSELKLLTMALEVVAEPKVLFLDEPTSGLSVSAAMTVVAAMRSVCSSGTCVLCTIHQPSQEVFNSFDRLLFLRRGGQTVYGGEISRLPEYFQSLGAAPLGPKQNVADWMLEVVTGDTSKDWHVEWNASQLRRNLDEEVEALERDGSSDDATRSASEEGKRSASSTVRAPFAVQVKECIIRQLQRYYRMPEYNFSRVMVTFSLAVMIGILFLREIDSTQTGATLIVAAAFLATIPGNLSVQEVVAPTLAARLPFYRELASGTYQPTAHHASIGIAEVPFTFAATLVFAVTFYFLIGLTPSKFPFFLLIEFLYIFFTVMLGVAIASLSATVDVALVLTNVASTIFSVLSGFLIRKPNMPVWWRWFTWINPFFWALSGILRNELKGKEFTCTESELSVFQLPPEFSSCSSIPGGPVGGYGSRGSDLCTFCPIPNGDVLLEAQGATSNKWIAVLALLVWIFICRVAAGYGFRYKRFMTR